MPAVAEGGDCACARKVPAAHACCSGSKPRPVKNEPKKDCCTVAPNDRSQGEAVEFDRRAPVSGPRLASPATVSSLSVVTLETPWKIGAARDGDPPGETARIYLTNRTLRI